MTRMKPIDYIISSIKIVAKNNPGLVFLELSDLAEMLKVNKDELRKVVIELQNAKVLTLHPSWPRREAIFIPG